MKIALRFVVFRMVVLMMAGVSLFLINFATSVKMGMPEDSHWDWFVLGFSGVGMIPGFATFAASFLAFVAVGALGLIVGLFRGSKIVGEPSETVLSYEVVGCITVYFGITSVAIDSWDRPSTVEFLAMASFFVCSYGFSRLLILSMWVGKRIKHKWTFNRKGSAS